MAKLVRVTSPVHRGGELWVSPDTYELVREFDKDRLIIRTHNGRITLVYKVMTDWEEPDESKG